MSARRLGCLAALILAAPLSFGAPAPAAGGAGVGESGWSIPRSLGGCSEAQPAVAFPSESPSIPTGPGAIVWLRAGRCQTNSPSAIGSNGELSVAALGHGEGVLGERDVPLPAGASPQLTAVGASRGHVAVAQALRASPEGVDLLQGRATAALRAVLRTSSAAEPFSLARAYLGDAALATVDPGVAIEVRVQRWFRSSFEPPLRIPIGSAPVSALVATMDYRADVLVVWQQSGAIFARMLRASGRREPTQRVASCAPAPQLQAVVSDNDHGMIAWSGAGGRPRGAATSIRIAFSAAGVRFGGSRLIASFEDPRGVARAPGSLELVRLSSENVMLAWTDAEQGHLVVRAAPAVFAGTHPAALLSDPHAQSALAALAPGPAGEAVAIWRSARVPGASPDSTSNELWAARAFIERHGRVGARAPERIAASAASGTPSLAVDPASDRPVAAWLRLGSARDVVYSVGPGASGYRPRPLGAAVATSGGGSAWPWVAGGLAAAALIGALTVLALRRRAGARGAAGMRTGTRRPR